MLGQGLTSVTSDGLGEGLHVHHVLAMKAFGNYEKLGIWGK